MSEKDIALRGGSEAAATEDDGFARELAAMRREAALAEERIIRHVCAKTGGLFIARYGRDTPKGKFTLQKIEKEAPAAAQAGWPGGLRKQAAAETGEFSVQEFVPAGWCCPYCGAKEGFVRCGSCKLYACRARVREMPDGSEFFVCHDGCGSTGRTAPLEKVSAAQAGSKPRSPALAAPSSRPALPGTAPRLPKPKK